LKTNRGTLLKTVFFQKIRRTAKKFDVNTQEIRADLILDLKALAEMAHEQATKTSQGSKRTKQHQKWAQLAAYISRSINIITREYDTGKIKEKLEELEKRINDEFGEETAEA
jgi:polyhydroxyalkanoate synthesis regulator phasin